MVFLNNILMALKHTVFNDLLDLIYDQCYPLYAKITSFVLHLLWLLLIQ